MSLNQDLAWIITLILDNGFDSCDGNIKAGATCWVRHAHLFAHTWYNTKYSDSCHHISIPTASSMRFEFTNPVLKWQSSWGHCRRMWSPVTGHHRVAIFLRTLQEDEDVVSYDWSPWSGNLPEDIAGGCGLLWLVTMEWQSSWGHCRRMWSPVTGHHWVAIFLRTLQEDVISSDWSPWSGNLPEDIAGGCGLLWLVTIEWQSSWGHCRRMLSPVTGHYRVAILLRTLQEDVISCDWTL